MGGDTGGIERVYRRRRWPPGPYFVVVGVLCLNALIQVEHTLDDPYRTGWAAWVFLALMALTVLRVALEQFRAHTRVTAAGITAQGTLRSRTWAWHEVYDIRVEHAPRGSGRTPPQWLTYLYDLEGRRFLLRHLDDWQLADPYAEVSDLCLAAAPYRSLTWERRPQVEERILRRAARRKAWTWAAYGALIMFFAMLVLDIGLVATGRPEHVFLLFVCVPLAFFGVLGAGLRWYWTNHPPRSLAQQP
ncbi:PH domain-containing protein [Streptomyces guryensis]|uniref:PH domain-containing protein n=1 Tax=Streptomyces guryensis TaxID=2886947 RepID=A0A9Q3VZ85_9ACTN|nr:PH domain-containing protein [Streptomyces guryensis]MCD9880280.1 PH domain-containing protein [Streptomyces guryensis]